MRKPVPEHKTVYVRFHKTAMDIIERVAKENNKRNSTTAYGLIDDYMRRLYTKCNGRVETLKEDDLELSPLSSAFFIRRGRSLKSVIAKPMNLTVDKTIDRDMTLLANKFGISTQDFRIAIIISYGINHNVI